MDIVILNLLKNNNSLQFSGSLFNPNNKSYYGYRIDLLKSAIQKYLRRREKDKMLWVMCELYMFNFGGEKGYIVLSNIVNRIKIFLDEEMCFDDWERYLMVMKLLETFENNNKKGLDNLIKICLILLDCNMIRLNSDIKCYYKIAVDKYDIKICECDGNRDKINIYVKKNDIEHNIVLCSKFVELLEKKNKDCFYYAIKLVVNEESKDEKGGTRFRRKGSSYILWEYLINESMKKENDNLNKLLNYRLKEFHKKRGERIIFLTSAISLLLYYEEINWNNNIDFNIYNINYLEILENRKKMEIDDYCMDMHCKQGREKGMNKVDFVMNGSLVINEYMKYYNDDWRKLYKSIGIDYVMNKEKIVKKNKKKKINDDLEKKLTFIDFDEFKDITLCTEVTCGNKVMCVFAILNGKNVCLKEGRKSMNYNRDYCVVDGLKKCFGLNEIGMYRIKSNKTIIKCDKKIKIWENNWKLEEKENTIYCVMNVVKDAKEIGYYKNNLNKNMLYEFLKIGLFRYIFKVTDFNIRNVLVNEDGKLISIDEGSLGKKKDIWGSKNKKYIKMLIKYDDDLFNKMVNELCENIEDRKGKILNMMKEYDFDDNIINETLNNYKNIKNIMNKEIVKLLK